MMSKCTNMHLCVHVSSLMFAQWKICTFFCRYIRLYAYVGRSASHVNFLVFSVLLRRNRLWRISLKFWPSSRWWMGVLHRLPAWWDRRAWLRDKRRIWWLCILQWQVPPIDRERAEPKTHLPKSQQATHACIRCRWWLGHFKHGLFGGISGDRAWILWRISW